MRDLRFDHGPTSSLLSESGGAAGADKGRGGTGQEAVLMIAATHPRMHFEAEGGRRGQGV